MKKLTLYLPMVAAVMAVLAMFAFKPVASKARLQSKPLTVYFFELDPTLTGYDPHDAAYRLDPDHYRLVNGDGTDKGCAEAEDVMCQIQTTGTESFPIKPVITPSSDLEVALDNNNGFNPAPLTDEVYLTEEIEK